MNNINKKITASILALTMIFTQYGFASATTHIDTDNNYFYESFDSEDSFNVITSLGENSANGKALASYMQRNNHNINNTLTWSGTAEDGFVGATGQADAVDYNAVLVDMSGSNSSKKENEDLKGFWYDLDTYLGTFVVTQDVMVPSSGSINTYLVRVMEDDLRLSNGTTDTVPSLLKMIDLPTITTSGGAVTATVVTGARAGAWNNGGSNITVNLDGVNAGEWVQIGIVLTRTLSSGETINNDYSNVIYKYSMIINGRLVEAADGTTQWNINPSAWGDNDYSWVERRIKNSVTTKEKFKGVGVASELKTAGAETGIDNILFRQYSGTEADIENDVTYTPSESGTVDDVIINFANNAITDNSAPAAVKKGIIDYNSVVVTKYAADGVTTTALNNDEIIEDNCTEKAGNNGQIYPGGSVLKLTNLGVDLGEYITIEMKDVTGKVVGPFTIRTNEEEPVLPPVVIDNRYFYESFDTADSFNVITSLGESSTNGKALASYMQRNNHNINNTLTWSGTDEDGFVGATGQADAVDYNAVLVDMSGSNSSKKENEDLKGFWYDLDTYLGTFVVTQDVMVPSSGSINTYLVRVMEDDLRLSNGTTDTVPSLLKMIDLPTITTSGGAVTATVVTGARAGAWNNGGSNITVNLDGVNAGEWVQIGIVLTRTLSSGETINNDYSNVIYKYSMIINGRLVEAADGTTQWNINPSAWGDNDYSWVERRIKNSVTTKEKFKGVGVASELKTAGAETGIDNILFRQYSGTEADIENDVTYTPSESGTVDDVIINFANNAITDNSAPAAVKKGIIDYNSVVVTKYAADGVTTTALNNDEIIEDNCTEKAGNNGQIYPGGSVLKLTNLGIDGGEYVIITFKDVTGNAVGSFKVNTTEEAPEIPIPPTPSEPEEPIVNDNLYLYEDFSDWNGSSMTFGAEFSASKGARVPYLFPDNSETLNQLISWHGTSSDGYMAAKGNPAAPWNNKAFSMSNDGGKTVNRGFKSDWLEFLGTIVITEDIKTPQLGSSQSVLGSVFSKKSNLYTAMQNYIIEYASLSFTEDKKLKMSTGYGDFAGGMWQNWTTVDLAQKGINPGDWYQAGVVLTRYTIDGEDIAEDFSNVRYRYSLLVNGTPLSRNGVSSWVINPLSSYESNGKTIYPCPEGLIANGVYKRDEFLGLGITSFVSAKDGLEMGFDNINMRVYEKTSIPQILSVSADTQVVDIPVRNTAMPAAVLDKIACGVVDINYGNNLTITAVKYDAADTFMANGIDITNSVKLVNNEDKYRNTLWDIKTNDVDHSESYVLPNGNVLRMTGIDLEPNERIVVTFNGIKDILGNDLLNNQIVLYSDESTDLDIVKIQFSDVNGELLSLTKTSTETIVPASATKIAFYVDDVESREITLKTADGTFSETAIFSNGIYVIDLQESCLKANTLYKIYYENEEKGAFKTDSGKWIVHSVNHDGTNTVLSYTNSSSADKEVFVVYSGSDESGIPINSGCFVQKLDSGKNENISKNTPTEATNNTAFVLEKLYNGIVNTDLSIMSAEDPNSDNEFTVKGKLPGHNKFAIAVYKSGNDWKNENNEVSSAQLLYAQNVATLENGSYSAKFRFKNGLDTSGEYTIVAYTNNGLFVDTVSYSDSIENAQALQLLNSATEKDAAWGIINSKKNELSFGYAYYDNLTEEQQKDVAQMLLDYKQKYGNFNKNTAIDVFRQGVMVVSFNSGLDVSIKDFERSVSYLSADPINIWLNKTGYVIDVQASWIPNINSRLKSKQVGSIDDFRKAVIASLVFSIIDTPVSVAVLSEMFSDFAGSDYINLDSNFLINKVMNKVYASDKSYSGFDFSSLKTDMIAYKNANVSPEGGGGSSSGGGISSKPTIPVVIGQGTNTAPVVSSVYTDLDGFDWAKDAIEELSKAGVISGRGDGKFVPSDNVKREEFVKMIVCLLGIEEKEGKASFTDVADNGWYNSYIKVAVDNNLVNGREDGSFGIGDDISRQDICKIIYNTLQLKGVTAETTTLKFTDYDDVSDYAVEAVETLEALNIVNGYEDLTFRPHAFATRAEAAKIVYVLSTLIK